MLIEALQARTRVSSVTLNALAASASKRYKVYTIPKRDGSPREICHPSKTLKAVQRWLTRNLLSVAPTHFSATAYEKGRSIRENAMAHAASNYTLRIDFADFFPSFTSVSIEHFLRALSISNNLDLSHDDIDFATRIFTRFGKLTIGAPSSPKLSNVMMFDFDEAISGYAVDNNLIYTRYADDIFISGFQTPEMKAAEEFVRSVVERHDRPKLNINSSKTKHLSKKGHRSITGLVITPSGDVSIGRDRKREIRTLTFLALNKKLSPSDLGRLKGLLAFVSDVEPKFVVALSRKFQIDVTKMIL